MDNTSTSVLDERRTDLSLGGFDNPPTAASELQNSAKRTLDLFGAATFILLFFPLLLGVVLLVLAVQGRPILYGHARIGRGGRSFRCYKFRTMVTDGDRVLADHLERNPQARREWETTRKLADDPRVTRLGRTLRKLSVDELPQFLNVLAGDMSLVGPRPIVEAETGHYGRFVETYFSVRPGITGLWQVSGRSSTSYEQRVSLDVAYVGSWTFRQDLMILAKTVPAVLTSKGSC